MSGPPAAEPGGTTPAWNVNPWHGAYPDSLEHQWDQVAVPFWREIERPAAERGTRGAAGGRADRAVAFPGTAATAAVPGSSCWGCICPPGLHEHPCQYAMRSDVASHASNGAVRFGRSNCSTRMGHIDWGLFSNRS